MIVVLVPRDEGANQTEPNHLTQGTNGGTRSTGYFDISRKRNVLSEEGKPQQSFDDKIRTACWILRKATGINKTWEPPLAFA